MHPVSFSSLFANDSNIFFTGNDLQLCNSQMFDKLFRNLGQYLHRKVSTFLFARKRVMRAVCKENFLICQFSCLKNQ